MFFQPLNLLKISILPSVHNNTRTYACDRLEYDPNLRQSDPSACDATRIALITLPAGQSVLTKDAQAHSSQ